VKTALTLLIFNFLLFARDSAGSSFSFENNNFTDTTYQYLFVCPGQASVQYENFTLLPGDVQVFHFTGQNGADSLVKVIVQHAPPVDFWAEASPACPNNANGQIHFFDHVGPTAPYQFSIDGGATFHDEYTYINLPAGQYQLRARDASGCVYNYSLEITDMPRLQVEMPVQVVSCQDSVQLAFSIAPHPVPYSWYWTPLNGATFSGDSLIWAKTTGHYRLTVENQCELFNGTVLVEFEKELAPQIYLPNSFSPNGDGTNDCFRAFAAPGLQFLEFQLLVFDRWGGKVFETNDPNGCWDGTFKGKVLNPGVLAWVLLARVPDCGGGVVELVKKGGVIAH
jgi:gliding motility-associated-like protein